MRNKRKLAAIGLSVLLLTAPAVSEVYAEELPLDTLIEEAILLDSAGEVAEYSLESRGDSENNNFNQDFNTGGLDDRPIVPRKPIVPIAFQKLYNVIPFEKVVFPTVVDSGRSAGRRLIKFNRLVTEKEFAEIEMVILNEKLEKVPFEVELKDVLQEELSSSNEKPYSIAITRPTVKLQDNQYYLLLVGSEKMNKAYMKPFFVESNIISELPTPTIESTTESVFEVTGIDNQYRGGSFNERLYNKPVETMVYSEQ